jgi:6-phosphofructokinase 1
VPLHLFLSYNHHDEVHRLFVQKVWSHLQSQPDIIPFFYLEAPPYMQVGDFWEHIHDELTNIHDEDGLFILFVGETLGDTQKRELDAAEGRIPKNRRLWVRLAEEPDKYADSFCRNCSSIDVPSTTDPAAENCAREIVAKLGKQWHPPRGIPPGYPFASEKEIIELYKSGCGHEWMPPEWPQVKKWPAQTPNPISPIHIGAYRSEDAVVRVYARMDPVGDADERDQPPLTFPEAGPRASLRFPFPHQQHLRVGVLVSGGIAPGINAVIDAIVARHIAYEEAHNARDPRRQRHYQVIVDGYREGFRSLTPDARGYRNLRDTAEHSAVEASAHLGGSVLGTSRVDSLLELSPAGRERMKRLLERIQEAGLDILYVIGGDGSMRAAHAISVEAANHADDRVKQLCVVGIPKTMDNDILWVWQSFGFATAVDEATRITSGLHTEATSNPRVAVIQLFGSDSGFVVSHVALGSGVCDAALIPEVPFSLQKLSEYMRDVLRGRHGAQSNEMPHGLIVMAETAIPTDFESYLYNSDIALSSQEQAAVRRFIEDGRRVRGQTPDLLRSAALKLVSRVLERDIRGMGSWEYSSHYWGSFRVFANEPRHIVRSSAPTVVDAILAQRLGTLAVDSAMAGYSDFMVSQWLTEYVLVPLPLVVLGRKRVPQEGIFWKSVVASLEAHSNVAADFFETGEEGAARESNLGARALGAFPVASGGTSDPAPLP